MTAETRQYSGTGVPTDQSASWMASQRDIADSLKTIIDAKWDEVLQAYSAEELEEAWYAKFDMSDLEQFEFSYQVTIDEFIDQIDQRDISPETRSHIESTFGEIFKQITMYDMLQFAMEDDNEE
jgi:hypothetical protein